MYTSAHVLLNLLKELRKKLIRINSFNMKYIIIVFDLRHITNVAWFVSGHVSLFKQHCSAETE